MGHHLLVQAQGETLSIPFLRNLFISARGLVMCTLNVPISLILQQTMSMQIYAFYIVTAQRLTPPAQDAAQELKLSTHAQVILS